MERVRAPATSANLGSGFDVFGVALDRPADVVTVERAPETTIEITGVGERFIPTDPAENTAGVVAEALDAPAHITIDKGVRPSSGLGSSAASAAAAAVALARLYDRPHTREELVRVAAEGERAVSGEAHADNVAPAILGGFTVVTDDDVTAVDCQFPLVVCLPDLVVSTREARAALPATVERDALVEAVGHAGTLVAGVARSDTALVGRGMVGGAVTATRADLIDGYDDVVAAARAAGATGVTVSGAGPAVLAVPRSTVERRDVAAAMVGAFDDHGVEACAYQCAVGDGAEVL